MKDTTHHLRQCHFKKFFKLRSSEHRLFFVRNVPGVRASPKETSKTVNVEPVVSQAQVADGGSGLLLSALSGSEII